MLAYAGASLPLLLVLTASGVTTTDATPFVLTAVGLALTVAGPLLVSNRLAEPTTT